MSSYATPTCTTLTFTIKLGLQENWQTVNTCDGVDVIVLTGNFGTLAPPRLISFVADDPDDLDDIYSAGDTLTLGLDMRTDALTIGVGSWGLEHPAHGDRAYVDNLFSFSLSLGADYSPSPSHNLDPNTNTNLTLTLTLTLTLILTLTLTRQAYRDL